MLIALPPNLDLSNFVNNVKTTRSRLLHKEFAEVKRVYAQARILFPVLLHHLLWRGTALDPQKSIEQQDNPD